MPRMLILGTAGHIDHGKTTLVEALTGTDCDRLPEEKARGITIELGFAHLDLPGVEFGVVDVPGHERFVRAMVAGAGGIDVVMLVVAADEGVMPQTREHLDICTLLGVPRGLVALTKSDLCDPEWIDLVREDLARLARGTFLQGAPIVPCSAHTGAGLDELRAALGRVAGDAREKDPDGLLRLPLDRVFTIKGFGTVCTGTLVSGRVRAGDDVVAMPSGRAAKVRGVQTHGTAVEEALAGQRTAVNLQGVDRDDLARGEVVVHPDTLAPGYVLDGALRYLAVCRRALKQRARAMFHTGTAQGMGTVVLLDRAELRPGDEAPVQVHLDEPVVVLPGDRFILRGFAAQEGYGTTLGGGEVVRALAPRRRRPDAAYADLLAAMRGAGPEERVELEVRAAGAAGIARADLARRLPLTPRALDRALERLQSRGALVRFDKERGAVIHQEPLDELGARAVEIVRAWHADNPLRAGAGREEVRSRLPGDVPPRLFHLLVERLAAAGAIEADRDTVRLRGFEVRQAAEGLEPLKRRIAAAVEEAGLSPPRPQDLGGLLGVAGEGAVQDALRLLVEEGALVKVRDLVFARAPLDGLRRRLLAFLEEHGQITAQQFKELVGATRKYAIPLGEHFDAEKLTVRIGDVRKRRG